VSVGGASDLVGLAVTWKADSAAYYLATSALLACRRRAQRPASCGGAAALLRGEIVNARRTGSARSDVGFGARGIPGWQVVILPTMRPRARECRNTHGDSAARATDNGNFINVI
jgi:hypothetical protein